MKLKILVLLLMAFHFAVAQKTEKQNLFGEWAVTGWFNEDSMVLKRADSNKYASFVLNFREKNILAETKYSNPDQGISCTTGMLLINKATWELSKDEMNFDIKGEHFGVDTFHYKIIYTVVPGALNSIILKKKIVILSEENKYWDK